MGIINNKDHNGLTPASNYAQHSHSFTPHPENQGENQKSSKVVKLMGWYKDTLIGKAKSSQHKQKTLRN